MEFSWQSIALKGERLLYINTWQHLKLNCFLSIEDGANVEAPKKVGSGVWYKQSRAKGLIAFMVVPTLYHDCARNTRKQVKTQVQTHPAEQFLFKMQVTGLKAGKGQNQTISRQPGNQIQRGTSKSKQRPKH